MGMIRTEVADSTGVWISCLVQREPVRGVAAITPFLDTVTALTEGGSDFLRNAKILSLNSHSIKPYRMPAILKFFQLLRVALTAFFRKNHGLLLGSGLVVDVASNTVNPILRMFRFYPGLKEARGPFLVAGDTKPYVDLFHFLRSSRSSNTHGE
ncbi:MAG: hypothetical protein A2157_01475 [Deltaproteobacteria bacterium RBG_16_47_11]|nr:MAG: hypothetical protein A2157_01475 [Deltaproteobacteria bacterium RBG_16_47_11]